MIKTRNLKLVILLEYQNIKTFLQKVILQIGLKKSLLLKSYKTVPWTNCWKLLELFTKMNPKKQIKKNLELKK